jgi:hypothetical protein
MHAINREKIKRHASFGESVMLAIIGVFAYFVASSFSDKGIPEKWATAVVASAIVFGFVIYARRHTALRWSFWVSLAICLVVHTVLVWAFLHYVLLRVKRLSILFWIPVMLVETFVLFIAIKRIETKLTGRHETIKLRF